MVENIDWNVGRILQRLNELELTENTIVIYFSDNGPNGRRWNGGMRGIKGSVDEGGVRVPFVIRWPDRIPRGTKIDSIAGAVDLLPTLAAAAGTQTPKNRRLDGINLLPLLNGKTEASPERLLINVQVRGKQTKWSVRSQRFRLTQDGGLFDPVTDPQQKINLAEKHPEEVARMQGFAEEYLAANQSSLQQDARPFPVGHSTVTWLPARDGIPHGGIRRSARAPNCSFFTHWTKPDDFISWNIQVKEPGPFEVWLHYTCPPADVGSSIELSFANQSIRQTIRDAHDPPLRGLENDRSPRKGSESFVKDFRRLRLGTIQLATGTDQLILRAKKIPENAVADVRWLEFRRLKGK